MKLFRRLAGAWKAFTQPNFWTLDSALDSADTIRVEGKTGPLWESSIVGPCVGWAVRNFPQAPIYVLEEDADGKEEPVPRHPVTQLFRRPTPNYGGRALWGGAMVSMICDGNAYFEKIRNQVGEVVELWYRPHNRIEPKWPQDGSEFISHYEFSCASRPPRRIEVADIIHFRQGIDPKNDRKGLSGLKAVMQEVLTDEEAAVYSHAIMENMGVPGLIISPKGEDIQLDRGSAKKIRDMIATMFRGRRRGKPLALTAAVDITKPGWSPLDIAIDKMREIPETRICAAIGFPAAAIGFLSGLSQTKVGATMVEIREMAWEWWIIPMQDLLAETLDLQLLGEPLNDPKRLHKRTQEGEPEGQRVAFNNANVRVLQEDKNKAGERLARGVGVGAVLVADYRRAMDLAVDPADEIYLRPISVVPVMVGATFPEVGEEPAARPNGEPPPEEDEDGPEANND